MLKRPITYEDFDGNTVTEEFYFNISRSEIVEMEVEYKEGVIEYLNKIVASNNNKEIVAYFKKIVLAAYGEKSEDGKRFIKNEELREAFSQMPAYDSLFMELATKAESATIFINGIMPKANTDQDKPSGPPNLAPVPPSN